MTEEERRAAVREWKHIRTAAMHEVYKKKRELGLCAATSCTEVAGNTSVFCDDCRDERRIKNVKQY